MMNRPSMSYARNAGCEIHLAAGVSCPWCGRELRATDVVIGRRSVRVRLICEGEGCHRDVLRIEEFD